MRSRLQLLWLLLPLAVQAEEPAARVRSGFNPDISLILSGTYARLSNDPDRYTIPGFMLAGSGPEAGLSRRGFSLAESELVIGANADDLFYGQATVAITPENEVEVEEGYVQTLALPQGLLLRAGRFFSGFGYLNSWHPHAWDFRDPPLPYRAFFGGRYTDDGVGLRWIAPTEFFFEVGGEWFRGERFPAAGAGNDGQGTAIAYAHTGADLGANHAWRAGVSYLRAEAVNRLSGAVDTAPDAFDGDVQMAIADFVWKWAPHGNPRERNFKFQAEYLWRAEDGRFTADVNGIHGAPVSDGFQSTQSGWYTQAVWQFRPPWRAGVRYDQLRSQAVEAGANAARFDSQGHTPRRASIMLDWSRSEFSRVRLQVTRDRSAPDAGSEVFVQYIMSLGAHGAHAF